MFVQVIKGKTTQSAAMRRQMDRWTSDVKPGAIGALGGTAGVTDDGTFIVVARFTDADSTAKNATRPEQQAWFEETAKLFDGAPSFRESSDVSMLFGGGSDAATFVQIMEGTVTDRAKVESLETDQMMDDLRRARPDLLGSLRVWFDDNRYTEVAYFTSENDARSGESSAEFTEPQQQYMSLFPDMTFLDLHQPQLT